MKQITINLYHFSELSEESKQNAVKSLRQQCYEANAEWTWEDASGTTDFVEEVADVWCDIQSGSHGFYCDHCHNKSEDYDLSYKEEFEQFRADYLEQFKESLWCDSTMKEIVENWEFNENESYASNIADIIIAFCRIIDDETLSYYEDDNVVEWIETQDFDFYEDGRVYNG